MCIRDSPKIAQVIISQFGGPDGELAASMRYLSQRYTMPYKEVTGILTDIGTEELAHMEMVCAIVHQLTKMCIRDRIHIHRLHTDSVFIFLLFFNQAVHAVKGHSSIISDDASSSVCIRKACDQPAVPCRLGGFVIDAEHPVIVRRCV